MIGVAAAFAAALGVAAANVEGVACVDTTPGKSALVGLVQANSGKHLAIVLGKGCEAAGRTTGAQAGQRGDASGGVLRLDEADAVEVLALVDLASPPKTVSLMAPKVGMGGARAKAMRSPALLLRTRRSTEGPGGGHVYESLAVVALDGSLRLMASEPSSTAAPSGNGFETLEVQFEKGSGPRPDIVLLQHALPRHADVEQLPGPPVTIRLLATKVGYQRQQP